MIHSISMDRADQILHHMHVMFSGTMKNASHYESEDSRFSSKQTLPIKAEEAQWLRVTKTEGQGFKPKHCQAPTVAPLCKASWRTLRSDPNCLTC